MLGGDLYMVKAKEKEENKQPKKTVKNKTTTAQVNKTKTETKKDTSKKKTTEEKNTEIKETKKNKKVVEKKETVIKSVKKTVKKEIKKIEPKPIKTKVQKEKPKKEEIKTELIERKIAEPPVQEEITPKGEHEIKFYEEEKTPKKKIEPEIKKQEEKPKQIIKVNESLTIKLLSEKLNVNVIDLIKKLMGLGILATINQRLDFDTAELIAEDYGYSLEFEPVFEEEAIKEVEDKNLEYKTRPPVITIMGHVDHGKTSLLDAIRETNVAGKEAGGITQHIGAYKVKAQNKELIFLDTPGHEAFTAMRARGVKVTDIVVLVVAADDGVMPQTIEAIDHAKAGNVPILVAINKMDLPAADPNRVKQELSNHGLLPDSWGGNTVYVEVSARKKMGLDTLIEMLLLQAEMLELKAPYTSKARGTIIEAKLDKQRGAVATVLIQKGTLHKGDSFVVGSAYGKIRMMVDDKRNIVNEATPSIPVEILGLNGVPQTGDVLVVVNNEKEARDISEKRRKVFREEKLSRQKHITLEELHTEIKEGKIKDLNIVIKADVRGSVEALRDSLERMSTNEVRVKVIHNGVGAVSESDILLAAASNAVIICFNTNPSSIVKSIAEREGVDIRIYNIIYDAVNDIKAAMEGMLEPDYKDVITGKIEVRKIINVPKIGKIAGSMVLEGKVIRGEFARLYRGGSVIYDGKISSLKRFKDDVKEVEKGFECGVNLDKFDNFQEKDIIEVYTKQKVARRLDSPKK
jgi:translation initiation factor IF-2